MLRNPFHSPAPLAPVSLAAALALAACAAGTPSGFGDGGFDAESTPDAKKHDAATTAYATMTSSRVCVPGKQTGCTCVGGAKGAQVCEPFGTGYGVCECPMDSAAPVDTGEGDGGEDDAAQDAMRDAREPNDGKARDAAHDARHDARDGAVRTDAASDAARDVGATKDARPDGSDAVADAGVDAATCSIAMPDAGPGGGLVWAEQFGTTGYTWPTSVAVDPGTGDVVVAGYFDGTVNFGGTPFTSHGDASAGYDTFVVRFDEYGSFEWAKDFGDGLMTGARSVAVDGAGNVAFGGTFEGTVSFGGDALTAVGESDVFVAELDANGSYLWSKSFGAAGSSQELDSVVVDASGHVLLGGIASGGVDFGSGPAGGYFIAKLTGAGVAVWSTAFDASCGESDPTLAVDPQSNIVLGGCFVGTASFGGPTYTSQSGGDAFVAKYDPSGTFLWSNDYPANVASGGAGSRVSTGGLAVDACGGIFLLGTYGGETGGATISFGAGTMVSGIDTVFLAKLDPAGNGVWSDQFIASAEDALYPSSLAVDGAGGVTLACGLAGSVSYGGPTLTSVSASVPTMSLGSFDANGVYRWSYAVEAPSTASSAGVASPRGLAAAGSTLAVVGSFGGCTSSCNDGTSPPGTSLVFPGKTLRAVSAGDMFLSKWAP